MTKEQDKKIKDMFSATDKLLKNEDVNLSVEERTNLENIQAQLAGALLSKWLPSDGIRRVIMLVIFLLSLYLAIKINILFLLFWLIAGMFSPRIVGKVTVFVGKIMGK